MSDELCKCENTVFSLGGSLPTGTIVVWPPTGLPQLILTVSPPHLCSNRRPALGGRDVSAKRRSCGCTSSYPSCETWQRESTEHLENR